MNTRKELTDRLNALILDEDLDDEKLREASEGLLPNILDFLNGCTNCITPKEAALNDVSSEMERQLEKWGDQNHPILDQLLVNRHADRMCQEYEIPTEDRARQLCEIHSRRGDVTYMHILMEEVSEAASCGTNVEALRKELVQVAAVTITAILSLDRNKR